MAQYIYLSNGQTKIIPGNKGGLRSRVAVVNHFIVYQSESSTGIWVDKGGHSDPDNAIVTGGQCRMGVRGGNWCVDIELQLGGFVTNVEDTSWKCVHEIPKFYTSTLYNLDRNADLVQINSIDPIDTSGTVYYFCKSAEADGYEFFNKLKSDRIFQTGTLTQIHLNVKELTYLGSTVVKIQFRIWRYNGVNYDRISSQNITSLLSVGDNVITLPTPINVIEGDFQSITMKDSGDQVRFYASTHTGKNAYEAQMLGTVTPWAWDASAVTNSIMHIHCRSQAPFAVGIGDSIMGGHPLHHGMIDEFAPATDITKSWFYKLLALNSKFSYQNMGIANETMALIAARFARDVVAKKPRIAVINGGFNDWGSRTKAAWLADYVTCLDLCVANGIYPVVWSIMPSTNTTNLNQLTIADWNTDLHALVSTYSNAFFIDWKVYLGQFRVGGPADNLYDQIPAYNAGDGIHYSEAGYDEIADVMNTFLTTTLIHV